MISILFTTLMILSDISSTKANNYLKRNKRWENNGGMNGDMSNMFRGTAGIDYPDYKAIPTTNFRCDDQIYEGGLYADVEAQCQVYHVCHEGRKDSFLCGRGTIFNQEILTCDYWYSTECDKAPSFYYVNEQIGKSGSKSNEYQPDNTNNFNYKPNYPNNDGSNAGIGSNNNGHRGTDYNNNGQNGGFGSNNNGQRGFDNNNNGQNGGSNNNEQNAGFGNNNNGQSGGFGSNNDPQNGKEDCCCQKYSYKTPWEFPAS